MSFVFFISGDSSNSTATAADTARTCVASCSSDSVVSDSDRREDTRSIRLSTLSMSLARSWDVEIEMLSAVSVGLGVSVCSSMSPPMIPSSLRRCRSSRSRSSSTEIGIRSSDEVLSDSFVSIPSSQRMVWSSASNALSSSSSLSSASPVSFSVSSVSPNSSCTFFKSSKSSACPVDRTSLTDRSANGFCGLCRSSCLAWFSRSNPSSIPSEPVRFSMSPELSF